MKNLKVASRYPCGCLVRQMENSESPFIDSYSIEYCPKHKAADDMYEVLKSLVSDWVLTNGQRVSETTMHLIYKSLAKAEGK